MEGKHEYTHTPILDSKFVLRHHNRPGILATSKEGEPPEYAGLYQPNSLYQPKSRRTFINTSTFSTLTTPLCNSPDQSLADVDTDTGVQSVVCNTSSPHSEPSDCTAEKYNSQHVHPFTNAMTNSGLSAGSALSTPVQQTTVKPENTADSFLVHQSQPCYTRERLPADYKLVLHKDHCPDERAQEVKSTSAAGHRPYSSYPPHISTAEEESTSKISGVNSASSSECTLKTETSQGYDQTDCSEIRAPTMTIRNQANAQHNFYDELHTQELSDIPVSMAVEADEYSGQPLPAEVPEIPKEVAISDPVKSGHLQRQTSKRNFHEVLSTLPGQEASNEDEEESDDDDFYSLGGSHGKRSDPCTPTSPKTRRLENFYDPYQIFEVQHTPCLVLTVRVLQGRNITMGFQDYYDTPDPYIHLVLRSSPEGRKTTSVKENEPNPVWDESFTFFINFAQPNILEINLMESNSLWFDQKVGTVYYDIVNIREMDRPHTETFVFNGVSQVDIEFKLEFDRNPTLRYSLCLSTSEKEFIEQRKEKILEAMRRLLGDEEGPKNIDEVPTVAVLGSGGGFRAMTGYSGVFKALVETGILDCTMYSCGLSGSSWFLSTLYSHPKWPNLDMSDFLDELKHNIDKNLLRFLNASTMYSYIKFMIQKRREGQPVSFTDVFGRMVGETLLNGRMEATLTDQRDKIKDGVTPMPLYTCVHVKKDVPASSFQEWVEFSPFEIGMPKYGTFMDAELFGSKFFMGKLVKQYKEQPLHFLQGIWGSAFCILFKRLLEDNRRIDPVEMVRQEMGKQLDEARQESSSDCSEDEISSSSIDSIDSDAGSEQNSSIPSPSNADQNTVILKLEDKNSLDASEESSNGSHADESDSLPSDTNDERNGQLHQQTSSDVITGPETIDVDPAYEAEEEEDENEEEMAAINAYRSIKRGSVEIRRARQHQLASKSPAFPIGTNLPAQTETFPPSAQSQLENSFSGSELNQSCDHKKSVNWGACPRVEKKPGSKQRRQAFVSGTSIRKSRSGSKSYWKQLLKGIFESDSWELLSTRRGRAAVIHNFMRGLSLQQSYPLSPFTPVEERVKAGDEFDGIFEMHPTSVKHIYMVDAGLTFNSPYPLVLRPQRGVDIILSFDFSARPSDDAQPFKELLLAEKWARLNRLPFPPIDTSVFNREGMKELYIFRHPTDPHCPIVFHFVLINKTFKYYKKPGVPRETREEFDFAEFDVFDDPKAPYSTFNFTYTHKNFERMSQLMEFNTLLHIDDIKQVIGEVIKKKREGPPRLPIQSQYIKLLHMKSIKEARKLHRFISRMESKHSFFAGASPATPYYTPTPNGEVSTNPFFAGFNREVSHSSADDYSVSSPPVDSYSKKILGTKHLNPSDIFSESAELTSTTKDFDGKSSLCPSSPCVESVYGTPPDSADHFHHLEQTSSSGQTDSDVNKQQSQDVCGGFAEQMCVSVSHDVKAEIQRPQYSQSSDCEANKSSFSGQTQPESVTDMVADQNTIKRPLLSPKLKHQDTLEFIPTKFVNSSSSSSGFDSLGSEASLEWTGRNNPGLIRSIKSITGNETFSTDSPRSESLGSLSSEEKHTPKGKPKKDPPPNPFFKGLFLRPSTTHSTSGLSSNSQTWSESEGLRNTSHSNMSYHMGSQSHLPSNSSQSTGHSDSHDVLYSQPPQLNPFAISHKSTSSPAEVQPASAESSPEVFTLAPEAFKADGTPVFDSQQARMYHEGVKGRRKIFRRQSTISSLNSISLDESAPMENEMYSRDYDEIDDASCKKKTVTESTDAGSIDLFRSFDEDVGVEEDIKDKAEKSDIDKVAFKTEHGVNFDITDLSLFKEAEDSGMQQEGSFL